MTPGLDSCLQSKSIAQGDSALVRGSALPECTDNSPHTTRCMTGAGKYRHRWRHGAVHVVRRGRMSLVVLLGRCLVRHAPAGWVRARRCASPRSLVIADRRRHELEFRTDAGGAWRCIRSRGITFDLAAATFLARCRCCTALLMELQFDSVKASTRRSISPLRRLCLTCLYTNTRSVRQGQS